MVGRALLSRAEPGFTLPAFERLAPPPPPDLVVSRLESLTEPGDIVADLHGRGGWIARAAIDHQRRAVTLETSPLTRLLADVVLRPPDLRHLDAAFSTLSASPRGESSLKLSIGAMFATRCATCERALVADEFTWSADAVEDADGLDGRAAARSDPGDSSRPVLQRKTYRCSICRDQRGGLEQRHAPPDAADLERAAEDVGAGSVRRQLRERFPVPAGADGLVDSLLDLHSDRQLVGLAAILDRIEGDLRAAPVESALRLAFLHAVLPASRLGTGPGRMPAIRIGGGVVRSPVPATIRERNPWATFEEGFRTVRGFVQRLDAAAAGPLEARIGVDLRSLAEGTATAVVRAGGAGALAALATEGVSTVDGSPRGAHARIRLVLGQPPLRLSQERLAAAYHGTCWALGREAANFLPLASLVGPAVRAPWSWQSAALRQSLGAVAPLIAKSGRAVLLLEGGGADALVWTVLAGIGAGYRVGDARLSDGDDDIGGIVEFMPPGSALPPGPRTRAGRSLDPLPGGPGDPEMVPGRGLFAPPERIDARPFSHAEATRAISDLAVEILRDRGEPATWDRMVGEILVGLDRGGHLRRFVIADDAARAAADRAAAAAEDGPSTDAAGSDAGERLLAMIRDELAAPARRRVEEIEPGLWWLADRRDLGEAAVPLADRVEWAAYSLLSTSGPIEEGSFLERVSALFTGHDLPDESLIRACLESYRSPASTPGRLITGEDVRRRTAEHTELLARLVDGGHRLGMSVWIGRREQVRRFGAGTLGDLLRPAERTAWLPSIARASGDALDEVDCIWYHRGRTALLFEVEWTAMLGDVVLRRHRRIPRDDRLVRFLVVAPERAGLVRHKLAASPVLRAAIDADNWHLMLWPALRAWLAGEPPMLTGLEPFLGLDPGGTGPAEQMGLFDPPDGVR